MMCDGCCRSPEPPLNPARSSALTTCSPSTEDRRHQVTSTVTISSPSDQVDRYRVELARARRGNAVGDHP